MHTFVIVMLSTCVSKYELSRVEWARGTGSRRRGTSKKDPIYGVSMRKGGSSRVGVGSRF